MLYLTTPFFEHEHLWHRFHAVLLKHPNCPPNIQPNLDHHDALLFQQELFIDKTPASSYPSSLRPLSTFLRGGISVCLLQQNYTLYHPEAASEAKLLLHAYLQATYCIVQAWHKEAVKRILAEQLQAIESKEPPRLILMDLWSVQDWQRFFKETGIEC